MAYLTYLQFTRHELHGTPRGTKWSPSTACRATGSHGKPARGPTGRHGGQPRGIVRQGGGPWDPRAAPMPRQAQAVAGQPTARTAREEARHELALLTGLQRLWACGQALATARQAPLARAAGGGHTLQLWP